MSFHVIIYFSSVVASASLLALAAPWMAAPLQAAVNVESGNKKREIALLSLAGDLITVTFSGSDVEDWTLHHAPPNVTLVRPLAWLGWLALLVSLYFPVCRPRLSLSVSRCLSVSLSLCLSLPFSLARLLSLVVAPSLFSPALSLSSSPPHRCARMTARTLPNPLLSPPPPPRCRHPRCSCRRRRRRCQTPYRSGPSLQVSFFF